MLEDILRVLPGHGDVDVLAFKIGKRGNGSRAVKHVKDPKGIQRQNLDLSPRAVGVDGGGVGRQSGHRNRTRGKVTDQGIGGGSV